MLPSYRIAKMEAFLWAAVKKDTDLQSKALRQFICDGTA